MTTNARTKAVEAMLELLPHREVVEAFWDEAYTHGCTDEARRWIAGEGEGQEAGRYKAALLRVDKIAQEACDSQSAASDPPPMVSAEVLIEIIDNALGGEQADTQGNDLPDTEPATPDVEWSIPGCVACAAGGDDHASWCDRGTSLGGEQARGKGSEAEGRSLNCDPSDSDVSNVTTNPALDVTPASGPATPRRIVSMCNSYGDETIAAMNDGTMWQLSYITSVGWEWRRLPSVPQPGEGEDAD